MIGTAGLTSLRTTAANSCEACPAGRYCERYGTSTANIQTCPKGYLCKAGATTPSALDNSTISLCPKGYYCGDGETEAISCPVGTYQPSEGQSTCLPCPAGYECTVAATTEPVPCSKGYYCQAPENPDVVYTVAQLKSGTLDYRKACPAGSYGAVNYAATQQECVACPAGKYCEGGQDHVTGSCGAGFLCISGASVPNPGVNLTDSQSSTVADLTAGTNGACPKGHTCPQGTKYPIPCPSGSYQPAIMATSCVPCPAGKYCPSSGMASLEPKPCADRFVCLGGASVAKPVDGATGRLCAIGHSCSNGYETPCKAGTYGPIVGLKECLTCPPGYYCGFGATEPTRCENGRYCPAGATTGLPCPAGTYTPVTTVGLESADQCDPCPPGQYCLGGGSRPTGPCSAGSWCPSGATNPTFQTCPPGFYCTEGATVPAVCETPGTFTSGGARQSSDCKPCAAGKYCPPGGTAAWPCPRGHYCEAGTSSPTPCPKLTYNDEENAASVDQCRVCQPGFLCAERGIASQEAYGCEPGYYCPHKLGERKACKAGKYRPYREGAYERQCFDCPEGFHCPEEATATPYLCPNGTYCPRGATEPLPCPKGSYCAARSGLPTQCRAGFYCEGQSEYYAKCLNGTYCPSGSHTQTACPGGTFGAGVNDNVNLSMGCRACGRGLYSVAGAPGEGSDRQCLDCLPGYVCTGNTSTATPENNRTQGGYKCPRGHYCPLNSYSETPCPVGRYNKELGATNVNMCIKCMVNFYNDETG